MRLSLMPCVAFLAAAACAAPPPSSTGAVGSSARDCFNADQISGFSEAEGAAIRVSPGPGRDYELTLVGPSCDDVAWAQAVAIDASPTSYVCTGETPSQGTVMFRDSGTRRVVRCQITEVRRLEPRRG